MSPNAFVPVGGVLGEAFGCAHRDGRDRFPADFASESAGAEGSVIVGKLREKADLSFGWNAQTGEYGDLYAQGVIDPAKVVRTALQDAASVAGLLVTTEAMIAEKPKKETAPTLPGGAGMDF